MCYIGTPLGHGDPYRTVDLARPKAHLFSLHYSRKCGTYLSNYRNLQLKSLLPLGQNIIKFRTLLHLGQNVITFRTLLHLGSFITCRPSTRYS